MKPDKFQNKYRIPSARATWWNYGWNGAYFITICTANMRHLFGDIKNGKINFSHLGIIADILWHEIPHHASWVELGDFVVMPNHLHGILILNKPNGQRSGIERGTGNPDKIGVGNDEIWIGNIGNNENRRNDGNDRYKTSGDANSANENGGHGIDGNDKNINDRNSNSDDGIEGDGIDGNEKNINDRNGNDRNGDDRNGNERNENGGKGNGGDGNDGNDGNGDNRNKNGGDGNGGDGNDGNGDNRNKNGGDGNGGDGIGGDIVQTLHATSVPIPQKNRHMAAISPESDSISTIIRSYKSAVTKHANRLGLENGWHPRFHDTIIRDDRAYQKISNYIVANPENWKGDKFHS